MPCYSPFPALEPITLADARILMQRWLMLGGFAGRASNGDMTMTSVAEPALDTQAQRLVLSGYGTRLAFGIELNAIGLALWNEVHP